MALSQRFKVFCAHFIIVAIVLFILCFLFEDTVLYNYSYIAYFILYIFLAYNTLSLTKGWFLDERILPANKAVLITGCDSGFGNQLAKKLDSMGFWVFASCLFPEGEGAEELKKVCSSRLKVLPLDVRSDKSVEDAFNFVKENLGTSELWSLVNNAGVVKSFNLEFTTMEDFKETMEINTLGPVRVTKSFLPLLKKSKGRVVNVTSLAARIPVAELFAYSVSKVAALAFTQCLSQDMHFWGVTAISIEPETFATPMANQKNLSCVMDRNVSKLSGDILSDYGEDYFEKLKKSSGFFTEKMPFMRGSYVVVDDIVSAITQRYPSHVYKPRHNLFTRTVLWFLENIPYECREKLLVSKWVLGFPVPKGLKSKIN